MKHVLCIVLSLIMTLSVFSSTMFVKAADSSVGTMGLTYKLNDDGNSYTVTGCSEVLYGEVVIPDTYNNKPVTVVGKSAFMYEENIDSIIIGANVKVIEAYAFFRTSATSVSLPEGLKVIEDNALHGYILSLDIPDSVEYIGASGVLAQNYVENNGYYYIDNWLIEAAVDGGPQRVEVLPGTVGIADDIIEYMDDETGDKYVVIPETVKYIGPRSLTGYSGVYVSDDNPYFEEKDGIVYTENFERLVYASPSFVGVEVVIPDTVKTIDIFAFSYCNNILSVTIPDSVENFSNGLSYMLKTMPEEEIDLFGKPGLCFSFLNFDFDNTYNIEIICGCSSDAANTSFVKNLTQEYDGFEYFSKKIIHNEIVIPGRDATCTVNGLTDGIKCDDCKIIIEAQQSIQGGHNYGEMIVETAPTSTTTGIGVIICEKCGDTKEVSLPKIPVTPKTQAVNDVDGVKVTWNKVDGAAFYVVFRRAAGSSTWTQFTSVTDTEFVDKKVSNNKYYQYSVKAYNSEGYSSAYNSSLTKNIKFVSTPKLSAISNATGGVQIKWGAVAGATTYRVYRRGAGSTYWTYLGDTTSTSYVDSKASSGAYWRYTVRAVNGYYSGFDTNGLYIKRLANPYSIKTANSLNGVTVTWAKINGAGSYRIYRKAAGQTSWTYLGTTSAATYTDKNVKSGTYYKYTVRAASGSTYSAFYDGSLIRFLNAPVISGYDATNNKLTINWNKVTGASGYRVYRRGAGEGWKYITTVSGTSYADYNVTKNAYYRYTIRSVNGTYMSGYDNNGYLVKFVPQSAGSSSSSSSSTSSKPSTKNDIVAYYNNAINNAKKSAKNIVLAEVQTSNYDNLFYVSMSGIPTDSYKEMLESHSYPNSEYDVSLLPPSGIKCGINPSKVSSATITESGNNYVVAITLNAQSSAYRGDGGIGSAVNILTESELKESVGINVSNVNIAYDGAYVTAVVNKSTGRLVKLTTNSDAIYSMGYSGITMKYGISEKNVFTVNY